MRLIFIIQVFSYLLRRYSFLFYRGKIQLFIEKLLFLPHYFGVGNFSNLYPEGNTIFLPIISFISRAIRLSLLQEKHTKTISKIQNKENPFILLVIICILRDHICINNCPCLIHISIFTTVHEILLTFKK